MTPVCSAEQNRAASTVRTGFSVFPLELRLYEFWGSGAAGAGPAVTARAAGRDTL